MNHLPHIKLIPNNTNKAYFMIHAIAPNIWHMQHEFVAYGVRVSSRMTVIRLKNLGLWLHSPVPFSEGVRSQLAALGEVKFIIAPSKTHHLFMAECQATYPQAKLFGAPGLHAKRPDLKNMHELTPQVEAEWHEDLDQVFFAGIPYGNETVWFHKASRTLIFTDVCQWWQGDLSFAAKAYANITGVRTQLAVPRTVRSVVKNRMAARASAQKILEWPFERVVVAHNAIIEEGAHAAVERAFSCFINNPIV